MVTSQTNSVNAPEVLSSNLDEFDLVITEPPLIDQSIPLASCGLPPGTLDPKARLPGRGLLNFFSFGPLAR